MKRPCTGSFLTVAEETIGASGKHGQKKFPCGEEVKK